MKSSSSLDRLKRCPGCGEYCGCIRPAENHLDVELSFSDLEFIDMALETEIASAEGGRMEMLLAIQDKLRKAWTAAGVASLRQGDPHREGNGT
jgi:hypothetical protein